MFRNNAYTHPEVNKGVHLNQETIIEVAWLSFTDHTTL